MGILSVPPTSGTRPFCLRELMGYTAEEGAMGADVGYIIDLVFRLGQGI